MAPLTEEEEERGVTPKLKEVYARADFVNMVSDIYARAIDGERARSNTTGGGPATYAQVKLRINSLSYGPTKGTCAGTRGKPG